MSELKHTGTYAKVGGGKMVYHRNNLESTENMEGTNNLNLSKFARILTSFSLFSL